MGCLVWPFKKKQTPQPLCNDIISFTTRRMWTKKEVEAVLGAGRTIATYEKIKRERTNWNLVDGTTKRTWLDSKECQARIAKDAKRPEREEEKMTPICCNKCENDRSIAGKCGVCGATWAIPAPLTLIPGELYAMDNGKVERCEANPFKRTPYKFILGGNYYTVSGDPAATHYPRILHRLKVNKHMKNTEDSGVLFHVAVAESGALFSEKIEQAKSMMAMLTPSAAKAMRPILDEIIAQHYAKPTGKDFFDAAEPAFEAWVKSLPIGEYKRILHKCFAEPTDTTPIPVTYKPHSDCSKREVEIPDGWELVPAGSIRTTDMRMATDLHEWRGVPYAITPIGYTVIRPKPALFKVTGPGWYKTNAGWQFLDYERLSKFRTAEGLGMIHKDVRLISKATPAQATILDTL